MTSDFVIRSRECCRCSMARTLPGNPKGDRGPSRDCQRFRPVESQSRYLRRCPLTKTCSRPSAPTTTHRHPQGEFFESPSRHGAGQASVPSMMQDSQTLDYVRFSGYENTSMHMAVSRGSGAIGTADRGPEHAAEGGLALADRASVGGGMRHHGDHAAHRDIKADGVALAGALPGGRGRWPVARQEPAAGDAAAERRHQDAGG